MGSSTEQLPLPQMPMLTGSSSMDWSIFSMFQRPDVMVVPFVPSVGPTPPPMRVVIPLLNEA